MIELKIKKQIFEDGLALLVPERCEDNYLVQLRGYLFDRRGSIPSTIKLLNDKTVRSFGGNRMYMYMQDSTVFIYDITDDYDEQEEYGIGINRVDLIEMMKAWLELNELIEPRGGIKEIILQRDDEHINMIAHYEDGSEFKRTFNYQCNPDELKAIKDYYFGD